MMEERYELAQEYRAKSLEELNSKLPPGQKLPYILVVCGEIADLVAADRKAFQEAIIHITQRAQVAGICLVLATQFPRGEICTNSIKQCLPNRIALSTTSRAESRIIIDLAGAQDLFGDGDCLYLHEKRAPIWVQSPYISARDTVTIVGHWRDQIHWNEKVAE
jgi:S-DNA-T family DNA segregation ATPase FtsK/SpoIIIE